MVSTHLEAQVTSIASHPNWAVAILLSMKELTILCINLYLPPLSIHSQIETLWKEVESFITSLINKYPTALPLVGGDLNARLGHKDDFLANKFQFTPSLVENEQYFPSRLSLDSIANFARLCLWCIFNKLNLTILNGSAPGDYPGQFSFWTASRASTIDYLAVASGLAKRVNKFEILFRSESDHFPLALYCTLDRDYIKHRDYTHLDASIVLGRQKIKWSCQLKDNVNGWLNTQQARLIHAKLTNPRDKDSILDLYGELIETLNPLLSKVNTKYHRYNSQSAKWFDQECVAAKKNLLRLLNEFKLNPSPYLKTRVLENKRAFKIIIKKKKREMMMENWRIIIEVAKSKNTAEFWRLTSSQSNLDPFFTSNTISATKWMQFFSALYNDLPSVAFIPESLDTIPQWPQVAISEIKQLIQELKCGKAPGSDFISPDLLKSNIDWWAPILASLFTYIDQTAQIPYDWGLAIIIPIFKKGLRSEPSNYRPISLLNVISKLYAKHLCLKLCNWLDQENILEDEQAGFRSGRSSMDHCLILQYLIHKYVTTAKGSLYVAFIDLKAAFDTIPRNQLWAKLANSSIDKRLLHLMVMLHKDTTLQVRFSNEGNLTKPVNTQKGVRQGCILAPFLFNFYVDSLIKGFQNSDIHAPKLDDKKIPLLMYADDAGILSQTKIGLKRALLILSQQCKDEHLNINYEKIKIMHCNNRFRKHRWFIDGHIIDQVKCFRYLGVNFQYKGGHYAHIHSVTDSAKKSALAILRFFQTKGGRFIPAALKLFSAKALPQMLFGAQLGPYRSYVLLERVQSKFLRDLYKTPNCTQNAILRQESGLLKVETRAWLTTINYWLRIYLLPKGLIPKLLAVSSQFPWNRKIIDKIQTLGLDPTHLIELGFKTAKAVVRQRLLDIDLQEESTALPIGYSTLKGWPGNSSAPYLTSISIPKYRWAFSRARFNTFPSAFLEGRFLNRPPELRLCPCDTAQPESISHILLHCPFYDNIRKYLILPLLPHYTRHSSLSPYNNDILVKFLLRDKVPSISNSVAKFLYISTRIRSQRMSEQ